MGLYLHLARASELRQRPLIRDKFLVLAAALAADLDLEPIAAICRERVLAHNPGHMLGRFPTVQDALEHVDFQSLLEQLRRRFPLERGEHMLASLGIDAARDRAAYYTDYEYASSLLGTTPEKIEARDRSAAESTARPAPIPGPLEGDSSAQVRASEDPGALDLVTGRPGKWRALVIVAAAMALCLGLVGLVLWCM